MCKEDRGHKSVSFPLGSAILLLLMLSPTPLWAQIASGDINGTVTDASGASIGGAKVSVTNDSTKVSRSTTTQASGTYDVTLLPVGTYTVVIEMTGFKRYVKSGVVVNVTETTRADAALELGEVTQSVEVQGTAPSQVETSDSTLGQVVEERRIVDLPLNGRNFLQLSYFVPGVTVNYRSIALKGSPTNLPGGVQTLPWVNGTRNTMNAVLIDGNLNNDPVLNTAAIVPVPDAIQEFKIQTNLYSAEFGQGGGSTINIVTKSGGTALHGSVYEFLRNNALDARNKFLAPGTKNAALRRNQFGVAAGGPVPFVHNTFIFGTYEGLRLSQGEILNSVVPTLAQRSGNFSALSTPLNSVGGCITNNIIKPSCIDPVATATLISKLWPLPNVGTGIYQATPIGTLDHDQFLIKVDHNTSRNQLSFRYAFDNGREFDPVAGLSGTGGIASGTGAPGFPVTNPSQFQNFVASYTFVQSNRAVNQFRFGFLRASYDNNLLVERDNPAAFGFTYPVHQFPSLPAFNVAGFALTGPPVQKDFSKHNNIFLWGDDYSYQKGNHSLVFGGEIRRSQSNINTGNYTAGGFTFNGSYSGNALADFLLGNPSSFLQVSGDAKRNFRSTSYALFAQDSYKVRSNFTLNYGLRWEVYGPFGDPTIYAIGHPRLATWIPGQQSTYSPTLPEGVVLAGYDRGVRQTIVPTHYHNFAPRIGFAWDPFKDGKTSIRAGYGIYYDASILDSVINSTDGTPSIRPAASTSLPGRGSLTDPFHGKSPYNIYPFVYPIPTTTSLSPTFVLPDEPTAYVQQWNLTVQRRLSAAMLFQIGYVGTTGTHLSGGLNLAQACFATVAQPCNGQTSNTAANLNLRRPNYPGLTGNQAVESIFNSNYNGLQAQLTRDMSHGLAFQASYTWSKSIDVTSQANSFFNILGQNFIQDSYHPYNDRAVSAFDARNRFVVNLSYLLPFAQKSSGLVKQLAANWQTNAIITVQSGSPFNVFDSRDRSLTGSSGDRPNLICPSPNLPSGQRTIQEWFNVSCFQPVPLGCCFGNSPRNVGLADSIQGVDFSVIKSFPITESKRFEFRSEFFNLFNHQDLSVPIADLASPLFGQVLATATPERQIQFALKFIF
jgi:hypothetical protein